MSQPVTKLNDQLAIVREIRAIYSLLSKIEVRLDKLEEMVSTSET